MAEFAYNSLVNRSIGYSPFGIVTVYQPRKPIDLVPLPVISRPSNLQSPLLSSFTSSEILWRIALSNENHKTAADVHRSYQVC